MQRRPTMKLSLIFATIFCVAQKKADGALTATRVTAEKDGVKPPR